MIETRPPWWGYSKEHGWVVLDRDIPGNTSALRGDLMFLRCRDQKHFFVKWALWKLPAYQYAQNYVRSLAGAAAEEARAELDALLGRWPELRAEVQRQHQEIEDRAQALRDAEEQQQKAAAAALRKQQRAASRELKVVAPADE